MGPAMTDHGSHDPGWTVVDVDRAGRARMDHWLDFTRRVGNARYDVDDLPDLSDVEDW